MRDRTIWLSLSKAQRRKNPNGHVHREGDTFVGQGATVVYYVVMDIDPFIVHGQGATYVVIVIKRCNFLNV